MPQLIIRGASALSPFRLQALRRQIATSAGTELERQVPGFSTWFIYLAEFSSAPSVEAKMRLNSLLSTNDEPWPQSDSILYSVPRLGTLSPWSSKATDIASVCGVDGLLRVERGRAFLFDKPLPDVEGLRATVNAALHDPMTESLLDAEHEFHRVFEHPQRRPLRRVALGESPSDALEAVNREWGLALSSDEIAYLADYYQQSGRAPTDAELMMFAQINSEHCRHKIFNASWTIDGESPDQSLFDMIRDSYRASPAGVLSAYKDNASVVDGPSASVYTIGDDRRYQTLDTTVPFLMKVETHNHPTAIAPASGAATGAGGEIRDEAATGRGGRPKAGLNGFSVSSLRIPGYQQPWEPEIGRPGHMASALDIMIEGPIGAAAYNNEFGRPNILGYFRTLEIAEPGAASGSYRGYHKPIMIAGGIGNLLSSHVEKQLPVPGDRIIVLGGPSMLIGLGGGAASSMQAGQSSEALDFASVQRANAELERRCQSVIDSCWSLQDDNPIRSIHDVGAGGLSNAIPELVDEDGCGGHVQLRDIPCADSGLSPMEIWSNESQERYVILIPPEALPTLEALAERERCPWADVGVVTDDGHFRVEDRDNGEMVVDLSLATLLGHPPGMHRNTVRRERQMPSPSLTGITIDEAVRRVLNLPAVAAKGFLITIADRTVGGRICRDPLVGPWQVPVADVGVTASAFTGFTGEAMAIGERAPVAMLDAPASGRMAVGEAITNIASADVAAISDIRLSCNWMAAADHDGDDADLYETVKSVGSELCPALGIAIPVGKDSLSMKAGWIDKGDRREMTSPVSLVVTAFAPVADIRGTVTPEMDSRDATQLLLIDLGAGKNRLGGSALQQVYAEVGGAVPDLDDAGHLKAYFDLIADLRRQGDLLAYHDRSDGGLFTTLCEMAFASHCGLSVAIPDGDDAAALAELFNEELGAVVQVPASVAATLVDRCASLGFRAVPVAQRTEDDRIRIMSGERLLFEADRVKLHNQWLQTSFQIQSLRDDPECAQEELESALDPRSAGLNVAVGFAGWSVNDASATVGGARPQVAILREQGVNGHVEMARAFDVAGFDPVDVHMTEIISGDVTLDGFQGLAACGGFSYGDVLGAGQGWAKSVLYNDRARQQFEAFFAASDRFSLGVCNGCQMLSELRELIPGAEHWPAFRRNRSEQFEARLSLVEIVDSPSVLLSGMSGSRLPVAVAHGEGRAEFDAAGAGKASLDNTKLCVRYVDSSANPATTYPANPNGSPHGATGFCNDDGRVTIMMPHPERVIRTPTLSWHPADWGEYSPWLRMFRNARSWLDN